MNGFYRDSPNAVTASKPEMIQHAEEIQKIISSSSADVELVAVNKFYKWSFVGKIGGKLHVLLALPHQKQIRREYEFNGRGRDVWEASPNYVQLKELDLGQLELF
ncbi:hypothetical protein P4H66_19550 [Paenibacillus dokdonensis]|uniref:Uncharacterized protein n=1 Tax=Paenibacillus dokdonensis TaxID=2567944 RepID=A0ABU6GV14_9BACL|nr:hypothetical protein [Paenibacillus dokdonensis]MEC0242002.1 hypothetical protein [Paenibacillus dokdonensis]